MNQPRNSFKAGLFILFSIAATIGVIISIEGFDRLIEPVQHRQVTFKLSDNLSGLDKGDDVRVGGTKVGRVSGIDYEPAADGKEASLTVHFTLPRKYQLHQDTMLSIETTVTGVSDLNIVDLGKGDDLPPDQSLAGHPAALTQLLASGSKLGSILDKATGVVDKVGGTLDAFHETSTTATETVKKIQAQIDPAMKRYNDLTGHADEMVVNIRDMIGSSNLDFHQMVHNLNDLTSSLKDKVPGVLDHARDSLVKLQTALDSTQGVLDSAHGTMDNLRDVSASARSILVGNRSKFDGIIASLKTAGDNLKAATSEIRRSPWRLLYKPAPGELDNLELFDSARQFAEGANDMNDAVQALRDAINAKDVSNADLQKKVDELNRSFDHFQTVEKTLWQKVKD